MIQRGQSQRYSRQNVRRVYLRRLNILTFSADDVSGCYSMFMDRFLNLGDFNAECACPNQTVPYGTALLGWHYPRHFVPGYDRTVPPGHLATRS
jgi:hypothetical protein